MFLNKHRDKAFIEFWKFEFVCLLFFLILVCSYGCSKIENLFLMSIFEIKNYINKLQRKELAHGRNYFTYEKILVLIIFVAGLNQLTFYVLIKTRKQKVSRDKYGKHPANSLRFCVDIDDKIIYR